jgi:hypothetical protein
VVYTDNKGFKTVDYNKVVPLRVEAIREQQKTIDGQNSAIKEFKSEMAALKEELNKLKSKDLTAQK